MHAYSPKQNTLTKDKFDFKTLLTGTLPEDPPLLEELGIEFGAIKTESTLVFDVLKNKDRALSHSSSDLIGPMVYMSLFTFSLTLRAKLHFGHIYLLCIIVSLGIYGLANIISTESIGLTLCCNIIGYSFLPILLFSCFNLLTFFIFSQRISLIFGILCTFWGSYVAAQVLSKKIGTFDKTLIIGYPIFLGYFSFILMVLF